MAESRTSAPLAAHSILESYAERFDAASAAARVSMQPVAQQFNVRVDPGSASGRAVERVLGATLPGALSCTSSADGLTVVWLGPDEWLVIDPSGQKTLEASLREAVGDDGAIVDQSGQRVSLLLEGDVPALLAKGTSLDVDAGSFCEGTALQGLLAQAVVILVSRSNDASRVELLARTSFARYVADWLLDALADPLAYPASHRG